MDASPLAAGDVPRSTRLSTPDKSRYIDPDKNNNPRTLIQPSETVLVLKTSLKILKDQRFKLLESVTAEQEKYKTLKRRMKQYPLLEESLKIFRDRFLKLTSYYAFKENEQVLPKAQVLKSLKRWLKNLHQYLNEKFDNSNEN